MQLPIASNYNILIADKRGKMVVVECTPNIKKIGEAKSVDDGYLVCTVNSFISDKLKPYDFAKELANNCHQRARRKDAEPMKLRNVSQFIGSVTTFMLDFIVCHRG